MGQNPPILLDPLALTIAESSLLSLALEILASVFASDVQGFKQHHVQCADGFWNAFLMRMGLPDKHLY